MKQKDVMFAGKEMEQLRTKPVNMANGLKRIQRKFVHTDKTYDINQKSKTKPSRPTQEISKYPVQYHRYLVTCLTLTI